MSNTYEILKMHADMGIKMSLSQVEKEMKVVKKNFDCNQERKKEIESQIKNKKNIIKHLSPYDHVYLARKVHDQILKIAINHLFDDFV